MAHSVYIVVTVGDNAFTRFSSDEFYCKRIILVEQTLFLVTVTKGHVLQ